MYGEVFWKQESYLKQGMRWRIGDGESVFVWKDPWLKTP